MTEPEGLSWPGPNASAVREQPWNLSAASAAPLWATVGNSAWTPTAAAILLLALLGNGFLLHRLRYCCYCRGERRRKKADFLLAHLAAADLCCGGLLLGPQLAPSGPTTSDAACRLLRVLQGWGLLAPSNMLVLIAFERRGLVAPGGPSARRFPRAASASLGWLLALLLALPQASAFRQLGGRCLTAFPRGLRWLGQAYAAYWGLAGFVAPAGLLGAACGRILWSLRASQEEEEEEEKEEEATSPARPPPRCPPWLLRFLPAAKCASSSAASSPRTRPRARARALHLALALGALFALCGLPRFALELAAAPEGPPSALGSLLAATNAALNPFACLLFRSHRPWARRLQGSLCRCPERPRRKAPLRRRAPPPHDLPPPRRLLCPCQHHPPPHAPAPAEGSAPAEPFEA